jgi:hypothetical protein
MPPALSHQTYWYLRSRLSQRGDVIMIERAAQLDELCAVVGLLGRAIPGGVREASPSWRGSSRPCPLSAASAGVGGSGRPGRAQSRSHPRGRRTRRWGEQGDLVNSRFHQGVAALHRPARPSRHRPHHCYRRAGCATVRSGFQYAGPCAHRLGPAAASRRALRREKSPRHEIATHLRSHGQPRLPATMNAGPAVRSWTQRTQG